MKIKLITTNKKTMTLKIEEFRHIAPTAWSPGKLTELNQCSGCKAIGNNVWAKPGFICRDCGHIINALAKGTWSQEEKCWYYMDPTKSLHNKASY